jgi:hypothetical protein
MPACLSKVLCHRAWEKPTGCKMNRDSSPQKHCVQAGNYREHAESTSTVDLPRRSIIAQTYVGKYVIPALWNTKE